MVEQSGAFAVPESLDNSTLPRAVFSPPLFPQTAFSEGVLPASGSYPSRDQGIPGYEQGLRPPSAHTDLSLTSLSQATFFPIEKIAQSGFTPLQLAAGSDYPMLGNISVSRIKPDDILFMKFERFPVSDAGACEIALAVLHQIVRERHIGKAVLVELSQLDHRYHADYTGALSNDYLAYPCLLLNEALPMGTPFKVVSGELRNSSVVDKFALGRFLEVSIGDALAADLYGWTRSQMTGTEPTRLSNRAEELEWAVSAVESRREAALAAAAVIPPPGKVSSADSTGNWAA